MRHGIQRSLCILAAFSCIVLLASPGKSEDAAAKPHHSRTRGTAAAPTTSPATAPATAPTTAPARRRSHAPAAPK